MSVLLWYESSNLNGIFVYNQLIFLVQRTGTKKDNINVSKDCPYNEDGDITTLNLIVIEKP